MKTNPSRSALLAVTLASALLTGCTLTKSSYEDAPLTPVKFESTQAAQTFYNAILARFFPADANEEKNDNTYSAGLDVPMPLWYDHDTEKSYRVIVNEAVAKADANHDGVITETEAEAFAAAVQSADINDATRARLQATLQNSTSNAPAQSN